MIRDRRGVQRAQRLTERGKEKFTGSLAEYFWHRLDAMDFMNQAMILAATLLLCAFPFFLVLFALEGRSATPGLTRRLGLNQQAAADVGHLFASSTATSASVTGAAWVVFILSGLATTTAIQVLYQRIFDLDLRGARDTPRKMVWLGLLAGALFLGNWAGPWLHRVWPVLAWIAGAVAFTGGWWFTMWFLLGGRVSWRTLLPIAVTTALLFMAMLGVFSGIFSGMVISNTRQYGPIGTVFALMAWLIAIGVVFILGAALGLVWQERGLSFGAAFRNLRGTR
jgi:membrane protein